MYSIAKKVHNPSLSSIAYSILPRQSSKSLTINSYIHVTIAYAFNICFQYMLSYKKPVPCAETDSETETGILYFITRDFQTGLRRGQTGRESC